jgi:hypothetical protein
MKSRIIEQADNKQDQITLFRRKKEERESQSMTLDHKEKKTQHTPMIGGLSLV